MGENRKRCLDTLARTECEVVLVTPENLPQWVVDTHPLHSAYQFLSAVHKSDYLRAYFMHHHGGGYSDIKRTSKSWLPVFERLKESNALGAGYAEFAYGVAKIARSQVDGCHYLLGEKSSYPRNYLIYRKLKFFHDRLIGNGAFIFKPGTVFTIQWLEAVERRLDILLPHLQPHPARYPRERSGIDYGDGPSKYPVPWTFLLGDIVAPLSFRHRSLILRCLPLPDFTDYE
ncbi:hypothetical protein [Chelativorans alearense]|uniref:hypothetical protein n=1 Tax=Chelativorans alearense TaxID=2681495 RepID=UPI0013D20ACD|nr:hypothetical protein [Chelativorans alearense]